MCRFLEKYPKFSRNFRPSRMAMNKNFWLTFMVRIKNESGEDSLLNADPASKRYETNHVIVQKKSRQGEQSKHVSSTSLNDLETSS